MSAHGGARKGAGRKATGRKIKRTIGCSADEASYQQVVALAKARGQSMGEYVKAALMVHVMRQLQGVE